MRHDFDILIRFRNLPLRFESPRTRPSAPCAAILHQAKKYILALLLCFVLIARAAATDDSYYDRLMQVSRTQRNFIWDTNLVDTKNAGPVFTDSSISFSKFSSGGELAGLKLGMTMSEVVSIWGKPERLVPYMEIGPRFWYGSDRDGRVSLWFKTNRLVLIGIDGSVTSRVPFDNRLSSSMDRGECEKLLGVPFLSDPYRLEGLFNGEIYYLTNGFRTDLQFWAGQSNSRGFTNWLSFICVTVQEPHGSLRPNSATNLFDIDVPSEKEM